MASSNRWSPMAVREFVEWHEDTIRVYPPEIQQELRKSRQRFMERVPQCNCPCHQKGSGMMHIQPCCV